MAISNSEQSKASNKVDYQQYLKPTIHQTVKKYWIIIVVVIIGVAAILWVAFSDAFRGDSLDANNASQFGDFIGGLIGTVFTITGVIFVLRTFIFEREKSKIEKFVNHYFELLKLHRDNVSEIQLGDVNGRKVFVLLVRELRELHKVALEVSSRKGLQYTNKYLMLISYCALFFGVGPNSSRQLKDSLKGIDQGFIDEYENVLNDKGLKAKVKELKEFKFTPFEGHQSRLGHYYRHLYQTITFIDNQNLDIDKYEFVKTVRAQLSNHEQALLYINSMTVMGARWWKNKLIVRYKLVKNIPVSFFDNLAELNIQDDFPHGYFEEQERSNALGDNDGQDIQLGIHLENGVG